MNPPLRSRLTSPGRARPVRARPVRARLLLAATATLALAVSVLLLPVSAHEGEDHGGGTASTTAATGDTVTVGQDAQFALGLRTALADTQAVFESVRLAGELAAGPGGEAVVSSPQEGRLVSARLPSVGTNVRAGQVMGTVEGTLGAPEVADLRTARAEAEAELAQARADVTRLRALARVVPRKEIEAAEIRLEGARGKLAALGPALDAGNRYPVRAPISGVVAEVTAAEGQFVEAGMPLVRLVSLGRLQVRARVPEADLGRVRGGGRRAVVTTPAYPDAEFSATLLSFGAIVDPESRTVDAVFALDNPGGQLKLGQTVAVDLALSAAAPAVTVPAAAVVRDESGAPLLFVHPTAEQFVRRRVTLGAEVGGRVVVTSGITAGERVVVEGAYGLRGQ
jgi:membrane fusion protein, heavy metal efflux system